MMIRELAPFARLMRLSPALLPAAGASPRRGFSLVEVMAAAAIFGVGLAAIFSAFSGGATHFEHQRHTTHGIHLTEAKLEEILLWSSADPQLLAGTVFGPAWFDSKGFASSPGCPTAVAGVPVADPKCRYRVTWLSAAAAINNVRVVTVTTAWQERGQLRTVSFSTQRN